MEDSRNINNIEPGTTGSAPAGRFRTSVRNRIIWIIIVVLGIYIFFDELVLYTLFDRFTNLFIDRLSDSMTFIVTHYTQVICDIISIALFLNIVGKNRYIWRSFLGAGRNSGDDYMPELTHGVFDPLHFEAERRGNTPRLLLIGLALGFITNFTCILCAVAHGDIKLVYDFDISGIGVMLFALLSVFIQSSAEELWCRGLMFERIRVHYPVWVAIVVNGSFFGLMHIFNPGVSALAIAGIIVCGLSYSLVRWYTGSIWIVMAIHTGWNFTQQFLFGLPNSGLVSETSIFHMDAMNAVSNLIYNYEFGVEAAIPALLVDAVLGITILVLAHKTGRLRELTMSREKAAALAK